MSLLVDIIATCVGYPLVALARLHETLEEARDAALALARETRPNKPHLTLVKGAKAR